MKGKQFRGTRQYIKTSAELSVLFVVCSVCTWLQSRGKCLETFAYSRSNCWIRCVKCNHADLTSCVELQPASLLLLLSLPQLDFLSNSEVTEVFGLASDQVLAIGVKQLYTWSSCTSSQMNFHSSKPFRLHEFLLFPFCRAVTFCFSVPVVSHCYMHGSYATDFVGWQ